MSTKLNAEELAEKMFPSADKDLSFSQPWREAAKHTIRNIAQPIANERDELREALESITAKASIGIPYYACGDNEAACRMADDLGEIEKIAEAVLAKYQKQPNNEHA